VLDLGAMAGVVEAAPEAGGSKPAPVVVVDVDGHVFGIRVDSVPELDSLLDDDGPAAAGAALALPGVIRRCASGALMCLDLAALARDPRVTVDEGPG
jgi:chemotaxis signal transduction protein